MAAMAARRAVSKAGSGSIFDRRVRSPGVQFEVHSVRTGRSAIRRASVQSGPVGCKPIDVARWSLHVRRALFTLLLVGPYVSTYGFKALLARRGASPSEQSAVCTTTSELGE